MAIRISSAEDQLLKEVRNLKFGELLEQFIPDEPHTIRVEMLDRGEQQLINLVREYQEIAEIKVQDGLPIWIKIPVRGRFGKALKRIMCK